MIRLLLTSLYSILFLTLTGLADLAFAATSCQEQIAPTYTTYRYADALTRFIYYNGKTYAISKSAVTGLSAEPDTYFNFSANIDWRYRTTGQDVSSLKSLLAMGRYGDARPVSIPNAATRNWIVNQYSNYLGAATSSRSTYVNAWKEFGVGVPFTHFDGSSLPYVSWPINGAPNVATITVPQAVVMGNDGYWRNGEETARTSQIVEFDGRLDCAADFTPPVDPPVDPPPPGTPPTRICTQDINGNGDIDSSESAPCVQTPQGWFCPIGSVACAGTAYAPTQSIVVSGHVVQNSFIDLSGSGNRLYTTYYMGNTAWGDNSYLEFNIVNGQIVVSGHMWENGRWDTNPSGSNVAWHYDGGHNTVFPIGNTTFSINNGAINVSGSAQRPSYLDVRGNGNLLDIYNMTLLGSITFTLVNSCNQGDTFDGTNCVTNATCPLGSQYSCMDNNGALSCTPNQCFDPVNPPGGTVNTEINDDTMLQDDARNPDGSCAGQIIIFNGKASRCRPPGLSVGYVNNCCESDEVMSEDTGNAISTGVTAIKTMYQLGQTAYYTYEMYTGAMSATQAVEAAAAAGEAVGAGVEAAATAYEAGAAMAEGMTSAMTECLAGMINPATIAVAIVVMVVMKVLFGGGCDAGDIQTAAQVKSNQCHYIGDYCERHIFSGCVQRAQSYCCFNSMMARIIHEQGRPQLTAFGTTGVWGTPEAPNCRGFTPDEFQALDFARIDLSEYYGEIQKNLAAKVQNTQNKINQTIQNRVNQINP